MEKDKKTSLTDNPIIFLDIDGVLCTNREFYDYSYSYRKSHPLLERLHVPYPFNFQCVEIFNEILTKTNADIVISSDWKLLWSLEEVDEIFKFFKVIKSPIKRTKNNESFTRIDGRLSEIEDFIKTHHLKNYVIIDDLDLSGHTNPSRFIRTTNLNGLKEKGLSEKIIEVLNNEN